jgi:type IV pilus assembly protein PilC
MRFSYVAFDAKNRTKKGVIEAASLKEATKLLIGQGWYIKKITPRGKLKTGFREVSFGGVSLIDKVLFVKHLGTMVKSGININEALEVIAGQTNSKRFKKIVTKVLVKVKTGQNLANALAKFPKVFDPLIVNIIRVGEESGTLEENLDYLAGELEDRLELRRKVKAAAFYPVIVLLATFGLGVILAYFVLPKITRLFKTLSFELPLTTKILLWVADLMDKHGLLVILGVIAGLIIFRVLLSLKFIKPLWHWTLIKMPIIGNIIINYNLALINRTIGILLKSGLTIDQSIGIATETTSNVVYKRKLKATFPQIQKGKRLSDSLASFKQSSRKPLFPLLVTKMIGVGEKSGRLDESLGYLAEYFEKEVDNTTKNLTTVLEPILLLVVGLIVGFIAISVISPIYQVTSKFNR